MAWHKWFVRGLVFTMLAGAVLATLAYQHWTNPAAVRAMVLQKLQAMYPGAAISVEAASLHPFGYIRVSGLRVARLDNPHAEVLRIPSATLYHNKEEVLEGKLSFRKCELPRPVLRIVRGPDGTWNVQGLSAGCPTDQAVPTVVIQQATVQLEDQRAEGAPFKLDLTQANLTLINDPLDVITIDGTAQSDVLGRIVVHGVLQRQAGELTISLRTIATPLNGALLDRIGSLWPLGEFKDAQLQGQADVQVNLVVRPGGEPAWTCDAQCRISKAGVRHAKLPFALEKLEALVRFDGTDVRVEYLQARAGAAVIAAKGVGRLPRLDQHFAASLRAEHVELDDNLGDRLPDKLKPLIDLYQPHGRATLQIDVARHEGQWVPLAGGGPSRVTFYPEEVASSFKKFPYPLKKLTGAIHYTLPQKRIDVDLVGLAGERPVTIRGQWQGEGTRIDMKYDIAATAVPVDATLIAALEEPLRKKVEAFGLGGKVDVQAHIRRQPGDEKFFGEYHLRLFDGSVVWEEFPCALAQVSGLIDVYPSRWEFRGFRGKHGDGAVVLEARSVDPDERHAKPGVYLEMTGQGVPLDADLRAALRKMPALAKAWDTFQPSGRLNFTAVIDHRGREPGDLEVRVDVKGATVRPQFFAYSLGALAGHFHLHDQQLDVRRLSAAHDDARVYVEKATVLLHPSGAVHAEIPELQAEQLFLDKDLVAALPPKIREAATALQCLDPLRIKTRLVIAHSGTLGALPDVYWDGQAWLDDASLRVGLKFERVTGTIACLGRHNGQQLTGLQGNLFLDRAAAYNQPFRNVTGRFVVKEQQPELLLLDVKAPIYGGDITGQVSLDFRDLPRFELDLTASQIDLKEFGRHNLDKDKLAGLAVGRLFLTGVGSDPNTLDGHGSIDVPNGKLLDLVFLIDLIKFLGLRWPDRTMFEELHCQYAIRRQRAVISNLELFGNAVSFTGKGEINLDGTDLHLDLYPSWARIEQLLPPTLRSVPPSLSKNILTVEARGNITGDGKDIRFTKKPVPILVDPLLHLRNRLVGPPPGMASPSELNPRGTETQRRQDREKRKD